MSKPCIHGNIDGAMHTPCYQCRCDALQQENYELQESIERAIKRAAGAEIVARKARKERDEAVRREREACAVLVDIMRADFGLK